jgi:hypothetical protein
MKRIVFVVFLLAPWLSWGQLFPKIPDFRGNIERIVEKRYGKEVISSKTDSGMFKPKAFSGWKYTYLFDENSQLIRQTNTFQGKIRTEYEYLTQISGNRKTVRESVTNFEGDQGNSILEYENFTDQNGLIQKVNQWSVNGDKKELLIIENDAAYSNGRLDGFSRNYISVNGDTTAGERFSLFYNAQNQLIRIERKDPVLNLKTFLYYEYDSHGLMHHFSIDYLVGLRNYDANQKQEVFYKYDRRGNWTKRYYRISDKKKGLEAKRLIKYR